MSTRQRPRTRLSTVNTVRIRLRCTRAYQAKCQEPEYSNYLAYLQARIVNPVYIGAGNKMGRVELSKHNAARQEALNAAIIEDWNDARASRGNPSLGNATAELDRTINNYFEKK